MRTRSGQCYPKVMTSSCNNMCVPHEEEANCSRTAKRRRRVVDAAGGFRRKSLPDIGGGCDFFDSLPDDLIISILSKLGSSASCSADFINVLITCKRLNGLGLNSLVLSKASQKMLSVKAMNWSDSAHRFLKLCADSGNVQACYILGMIRFYCLQNYSSGASLMAKAAISSDAAALYSLAVIQFNGSGGTKNDKDLQAGVALCARAASLGHVDALRELGHCLQDGYGVKRDVAEGRRLLIQANARELSNVVLATSSYDWLMKWNGHDHTAAAAADGSHRSCCPLLSDFGCNVPAPEAHPANRFLIEWFGGSGRVLDQELRLCSHSGCGRPETRRHEFRRCSVCGAVNYCSRACQAMDWKVRHKVKCTRLEDNHNNNNIHVWEGDMDYDAVNDNDYVIS